MTKKILIIYDYFTPAYKAGGPIRSIHNLVKLIGAELSLYIIATNRDHDGTILDVDVDKWVDFQGVAQVFYASDKFSGLKIKKVIKELKPDLIHINGIFSLFSTLAPLSYAREHQIMVILSPRGMLQMQSLKIKAWKKKVYLYFIRRKYLKHVDITWHFTTRQEENEFKQGFGKNTTVNLIGNVPAEHLLKSNLAEVKLSEPIRFLTVALIGPMKNHIKVLECLRELKGKEIVYDIIGPIKDRSYWQLCRKIMDRMPANVTVNYLGEMSPFEVEEKYNQYHYYVQPSQSENFGHSIFEALACGVPVIVSDQTPWKKLYEEKAGWDVGISQSGYLKSAMMEAIQLSEDTYRTFQHGARKLAGDYIAKNNFRDSYLRMYRSLLD